jgi:hypothetical protein
MGMALGMIVGGILIDRAQLMMFLALLLLSLCASLLSGLAYIAKRGIG